MDEVQKRLEQELLASTQSPVSKLNISERMHELFRPTDYVKVANPFDRSTGWTYVDPAEEKRWSDRVSVFVQPGESHMRILKPGEQVVIPGWEAYIGIERMFKEYAQESPLNMSVVLSSDEEMERFLSKAFQGVFDPNEVLGTTPSEEKKTPAKRGRKPKAPAVDDLGLTPPAETPEQ